jgi:hypothetical protein
MQMQPQDEITTALHLLWDRLERLSSIDEDTLLLPGGQEVPYQELFEEAHAALGLIETGIADLRDELDSQHKRLNAIRDAQIHRRSSQEEESRTSAMTSEPSDDPQQLEAVFGPLAPHREFQRGEPISYRDDNGVTKTGTIVWVRAAEMVVEGGKEPRLEYVVATGTGSLELVRAEQILRDRERRAEHA